MADIFISYASSDRSRAKILAEVLVQHGWSVWWDRKILPGKTFDQVIQQELDGAKCAIILWSNESVKSDWVKDEAAVGQRRGILVPVLIDDVELPLGFRRIQTARLSDWQPTLPHPEFDLLLEAVAAVLGHPEGAETKQVAAAHPRISLNVTPEARTAQPGAATVSSQAETVPQTQRHMKAGVTPRKAEIAVRGVRTLIGHTKAVHAVAFSPDGAVLASASGGGFWRSHDCSVRLWRVSNGQMLRTLEGYTSTVATIAFSPDGAMLASGSLDGVRLWRVADGELLQGLEAPLGSVSIAFSPDGSTLASATRLVVPGHPDDKTVGLWRMSNGERLASLYESGVEFGFESVAFSPDGLSLAALSMRTVWLWHLADGQVVRTFQVSKEEAGASSVVFSPDGTIVAAGANTVWLWRVSDGKLLHRLPWKRDEHDFTRIHSVAFSPDGAMVAAGGDKDIKLWSIFDGELLHNLTGHTKSVIRRSVLNRRINPGLRVRRQHRPIVAFD